jgi:hypothetical protein
VVSSGKSTNLTLSFHFLVRKSKRNPLADRCGGGTLPSFFGLSGMYQSLKYLSLSDATTLSFLTPTCTALLGYLFLREPFTRKECAAGREYYPTVIPSTTPPRVQPALKKVLDVPISLASNLPPRRPPHRPSRLPLRFGITITTSNTHHGGRYIPYTVFEPLVPGRVRPHRGTEVGSRGVRFDGRDGE